MSKKTCKIILWVLCLLPLIITTIFVVFLPDVVPMHYNALGKINRWGSKYENYYVACILGGIGLSYQLLAWRSSKKSREGIGDKTDKKIDYENTNEKALLSMGCILMGIFVMTDTLFLVNEYYVVSES